MVTVWATSGHLMAPLGWLTFLSNASIQWKNRTMTTPRTQIERSGQMVDERVVRRTVEHQADEDSRENSFVHMVCRG